MSRYVRNHAGIYVPRHLGSIPMPSAAPSPPMPLPNWAPTNETELEQWATQQAEAWASAEVQTRISEAQTQITAHLSQGASDYIAPSGRTLDENEIAAWCAADITEHGFPDNADDAAAMATRFLDAQGEKMGFHPGFVGEGIHLVTDGWPTDMEGAEAWGSYLAENIAAQFGVPVPSDWNTRGLVQAASSAACLQAGVPFAGVVTTSIDSMWDGKLTYSEIENIVVAVGAAVGAAVGQMFGIPAPIGAFIGSITTKLLVEGVADFFGWGPSAAERRAAAWDAMLEARAAMMEQCLAMGTGSWTAYNDYWNQVIGDFSEALQAQAPVLGTGIRSFGRKFLQTIEDDEGVEQPLFRTINRSCREATGCLYWTYENPGGWVRDPPATLARMYVRPDAYLDIHPTPNYVGCKLPDGSLDPYAALAFYGAYRYVTPYHAWNEREGYGSNYVLARTSQCWSGGRLSGGTVECWESTTHTDHEELENLAYIARAPSPSELGTCKIPGWAAYLMASLVQVGPASAFVMNDVSATISANAAEAEVAARMQASLDEYRASRQVVVQAAQERRDILRMRRNKASKEARVRYGLLAAGTGSLAGWMLSQVLAGKGLR